MRIVQITEKDKIELSELGQNAVEAMQEFLECLDKVTDGQIGDEMAKRYGERRGARGTGPYGRGGRYYNRRDEMAERRGVPGSGRYGRKAPMPEVDDPELEPVIEEAAAVMAKRMAERYGERSGGGSGSGSGYGNRYDY